MKALQKVKYTLMREKESRKTREKYKENCKIRSALLLRFGMPYIDEKA